MSTLLDHPALLATDRAWGRFVRFVGGASRARDGVGGIEMSPWSAVEWEQDLAAMAVAPVEIVLDDDPVAAGVPLDAPDEDEPGPVAGEESAAARRRAGAAILRAIMLARQRRFAEAEAAFADAAERDPELDLARVPAFWELERGGQDAAVRALDAVGRRRDAMVLRARVENRYRPRIVRSA